jgi:superfamily II DNA or RNA helicase
LKVATTQPFQVIYSFFEHEFLGFLFEAYVVQIDGRGRLTFQHQHISSTNAEEFSANLDEIDFKLIRLMDDLRQDTIVKKHYEKKITTADFFLKIYDKAKGEPLIQETLENYVEGRRSQILELLQNDKMIFEMGKDGEPTYKKVDMAPVKCKVLFHFRRNEENTHYFPSIKYEGEFLDFQYKSAVIINKKPAYMLVNNTLYSFEKEVDGNKVKPFLNKKFIEVPRKVEDAWLHKFGAQLIASFDVYAKGFEIQTERYQPKPILTFTELATLAPQNATLFGEQEAEEISQEDAKIVFELSFEYGSYHFSASDASPSSVRIEKTSDSYIFHKVKRALDWEKNKIDLLGMTGMKLRNAKFQMLRGEAFGWLQLHSTMLEQEKFIIKQNGSDTKRYFIGNSTITLSIVEGRDWFDVNAVVRFGEYEIPFIQLRKHIVNKIREFELPNGEIAIIPEEWFAQYSALFALMDHDDQMRLRKHHVSLIQELQAGALAQVTMSRKLEKLQNFNDIDDIPLPLGLKGELRSYQKAGYNWMNFLRNYNFGGCLADDMGLGKTIQTLTMLLNEKERGAEGANLLIMPTSLLYNWEKEAQKFAPSLKLLTYTGINRIKDPASFGHYDLILTSYGTARVDIDIIKNYHYNYLILDESQAIKNPNSQITKEVGKLTAKSRLVLSGTPIENSTLDLWSQMNFVNPGLLGTQSFFKKEFMNAIEKGGNEGAMKKLHAIIKPFVLRRHKSQVAKELPAKVENIRYCRMTEEQEHIYEEVKSSFRNKILEQIEKNGFTKSQIMILQGLTKLRQLANHPKMVDETYEDSSGKLEEIIEMLENTIQSDHKVLVFSQFVKHLAIIKAYLEKENIVYAYLDGSTKDREEQVNLFQNNPEVKVFLISLKAGGVGLNLTAADYVFILDPWWNPAAEAQAIDRAHRIGQDKTVFIYKFITKNSVEEKILALQNAKLKLSTELITTEESFVKALSKEDISALLM